MNIQYKPYCPIYSQFSKRRLSPSWIWFSQKWNIKARLFFGRHFQSLFNNDRVVAVLVISDWRPPPSWIFSEVKYEVNSVSWMLCLVYVPNFVQICVLCSSDRVMAVKVNFKMAAAAILNLLPLLFLANRRIWIVVLYVPVKFRKSNSTGAWVIKFCQKFKMPVVRHLELLCGNAGPPMKSNWWPETCVQISYRFFLQFQRYCQSEILHIWLKTPIRAAKIYVFGGFDP